MPETLFDLSRPARPHYLLLRGAIFGGPSRGKVCEDLTPEDAATRNAEIAKDGMEWRKIEDCKGLPTTREIADKARGL